MPISRRNALLAGVATILPLPASASLPAGDLALFRAVASWREAFDAYETENTRITAIYERCEALMPDHGLDGDINNPENVAKQQTWNVLLESEGYSEDRLSDLSSLRFARCQEAASVPASTAQGLCAKVDMIAGEYPETMTETDHYADLRADLWRAVVSDIRRLAGGVA